MSRGYPVKVEGAPVDEYTPLRFASIDHPSESSACLSASATGDTREVKGAAAPLLLAGEPSRRRPGCHSRPLSPGASGLSGLP